MYLEIYQDLKQGFQQSWLGFLFKHSALGRLLVQENTPSQYEGRLNESINQAVPLPFQETELLQYSKHLKKFVKQYEQEQQRIALEDKLNQVVVRAQDAITKRNSRFFQAESNKSQLEKRRAQIEATITLISWLSDDTATLTQKELALLGQQESVKLILEKNPIQCPKIAWLKTQLEATSAYQAALYNQERRSLSDQKFLLGLEKNSLWANRQVSPQAYRACHFKCVSSHHPVLSR